MNRGRSPSANETDPSAGQSGPWLDANDSEGIAEALARLGGLEAGEALERVERAGEGNMNLALRAITDRRSLVVKQARPWVEKHPHVAAPVARAAQEHRFYQMAAEVVPTDGEAESAARCPAVHGFDPVAHLLVLEDVPGARDMTDAYAGDPIHEDEAAALARYAARLHRATAGAVGSELANRGMRALNHEHIYRFPLRPDNGLDLDPDEPGLNDAARALQRDEGFASAVRATGERYLENGGHLLHGDYFPGSWLRSDEGLVVIDPEFAFPGDPAFDVGNAVAHFVLARQPATAEPFLRAYRAIHEVDDRLLARYAACEVMRRIIGLARAPVAASEKWRRGLLEAARASLLQERWSPLCDSALASLP